MSAEANAATSIDTEKLKELDSAIDTLGNTEGELLTILHRAQGIFGYLPRDVQLHIARRLGIPGVEVYGVVSFYSFFSMEPPGRHSLSVCMGTACFVRGAEEILAAFVERLGIAPGETSDDGLFSLKDVRCVGACGLAPVVMADDKVYGRVGADDIDRILTACQKQQKQGD